MKRVICAACGCALLTLCGIANCADTAARQRLHIEQQQDAINLDLQQSARGRRFGLAPAESRRLDQLQLQQRMEQQQLELHQVQREHALRQSRALPEDSRDRAIQAQRDLFATERQLQIQRFELDQQRLLQSARPQPLQPPLGNPQLTLP